MSEMKFDTISELIEDVRQGKIVILVDDEDRENEGDLILAADHVTTEKINFMIREARGLVCLSLTAQQVDRLSLPLMVGEESNLSPNKTAFTVSIEASTGISTGISAADRAHTVRVAANPSAKPSDVHRPGHIFPIRAQDGGVLKRAGHTEGSVDLARLAGLNPSAVICEVINSDGTMARVKDLMKFAREHGLKIGTIVDLIQYRLSHESLVEEVFQMDVPARFGDRLKLRVFRSSVDGGEHLVLQKGEIQGDDPTFVKVQSENLTREFFVTLEKGHSLLQQALSSLKSEESGVVLLLRQSRIYSHLAEIKAWFENIQDQPLPHFTMDDKDYGVGAQILRALGVRKIKLLTSRPEKKIGLRAFGLEIVESIPPHSEKGK
jgi:3,4-dihydroxy 2-butanone 4-phosphate synthase/GTP cyclohydrolase II